MAIKNKMPKFIQVLRFTTNKVSNKQTLLPLLLRQALKQYFCQQNKLGLYNH